MSAAPYEFSRLECCELVDMRVVVRDVEAVDLGARTDEEIRKRNGRA